MKKLFAAMMGAVAISMAVPSSAAPDETQKQLVQRMQEAKKKLAAAQSAQGADRQKMMNEHMKMMQDMMAQMQKAKPSSNMKPEQMREWIDEHMKLMHEMMSQMMDEHHMMMQGMGGSGMQGMEQGSGMRGMGKK
jgi:uncharacterized protein YicC (UPF0701 family)